MWRKPVAIVLGLTSMALAVDYGVRYGASTVSIPHFVLGVILLWIAQELWTRNG